jgi:hypothetical protein
VWRPRRSSCHDCAPRGDPEGQRGGLITFVLKLVVTPALIAMATLLGRRFGQRFAGWLVGFPFTSGPVSLFLALDHGVEFAAAAAIGSIASVAAQAAFAIAYARTRAFGWPGALSVATLAFALGAVLLRPVDLTPFGMTVFVWGVLLVATRLLPPRSPRRGVTASPPAWDLPARIVVATALVVALTTAAPLLGPFTSGVVSGFPLYATVLGVFAHRTAGGEAATEVMRGLVAGLFGFATFFLVIASMLPSLGIAGAFALAIAAILLVQGLSLALLRGGT